MMFGAKQQRAGIGGSQCFKSDISHPGATYWKADGSLGKLGTGYR